MDNLRLFSTKNAKPSLAVFCDNDTTVLAHYEMALEALSSRVHKHP